MPRLPGEGLHSVPLLPEQAGERHGLPSPFPSPRVCLHSQCPAAAGSIPLTAATSSRMPNQGIRSTDKSQECPLCLRSSPPSLTLGHHWGQVFTQAVAGSAPALQTEPLICTKALPDTNERDDATTFSLGTADRAQTEQKPLASATQRPPKLSDTTAGPVCERAARCLALCSYLQMTKEIHFMYLSHHELKITEILAEEKCIARIDSLHSLELCY